MTADELERAFEEDSALAEGMGVEVFWTNSGLRHRAVGKVQKLNMATVVVILDEGQGCYQAGHLVCVPRVDNIKRWSPNNCARPLQEGVR